MLWICNAPSLRAVIENESDPSVAEFWPTNLVSARNSSEWEQTIHSSRHPAVSTSSHLFMTSPNALVMLPYEQVPDDEAVHTLQTGAPGLPAERGDQTRPGAAQSRYPAQAFSARVRSWRCSYLPSPHSLR